MLKIQCHSFAQVANPFRPFTDCLCNALSDVDQNLMDRLQRVNNSLHSQISRLHNIRNTIEETGVLAERARSRVESTEQLIEIASRELEKAKMAAANVVSDSEVLGGRVGPWVICSCWWSSVCLSPSSYLAFWSRRAMLCCSDHWSSYLSPCCGKQKQSKTGELYLAPRRRRSTETAVGRGRSLWGLLI